MLSASRYETVREREREGGVKRKPSHLAHQRREKVIKFQVSQTGQLQSMMIAGKTVTAETYFTGTDYNHVTKQIL